MQSQKPVTAHFSSEQLLPFDFAEKSSWRHSPEIPGTWAAYPVSCAGKIRRTQQNWITLPSLVNLWPEFEWSDCAFETLKRQNTKPIGQITVITSLFGHWHVRGSVSFTIILQVLAVTILVFVDKCTFRIELFLNYFWITFNTIYFTNSNGILFGSNLAQNRI